MQFSVKSGRPEALTGDCAVVAWFEHNKLAAGLRALDKACGRLISDALKRGDLGGKSGQAAMLHAPAGSPFRRILVVGCGDQGKFTRAVYRKATQLAANSIALTGARNATSFLPEPEDHANGITQALDTLISVEQALYRFDTLKSAANRQPKPKLTRFSLCVSDSKTRKEAEEGLRQARAISDGIKLARDLGNLPANVCTPRYLASTARKIAGRSKQASTRILGPAEMKRLGMGALLSVTAGATEPARLIVIQYRGAASGQKPTVLIGKGITFDTGGISLKPGRGMDEMKFDMCGAAGVLGAIQAAIDLGIRKNITAIVPSCVNMPDGRATNPGDIVTTMSGQTVEILNTDAEGRLILCDALTYAQRFKPDVVIDVATLTGACVVALGPHLSGLMSGDDALAGKLLLAGEQVGDPAWRLPLLPEYGEGLASNFADFANVAGREGGASIAASFLSRFATDLRWAHLDVAGTAWKSGKDKGATGRPVGLLVQYLLADA